MTALGPRAAPARPITGALLVLLATAGCMTPPAGAGSTGPSAAPGGSELFVTTLSSPPGEIPPHDGRPMTRLESGTETVRQPVGSFVVMREKYEAPVPMMHAPSHWTRLHLSFDSPDGRVNVTLTDDGENLSTSARSPGCMSMVRYLQYGPGEDERHLFDAMLLSLDHLAGACGAGLQNPERYRLLLDGARADFPEAMRAMKAGIATEFRGRTKRCRAPKQEGWVPSAFPPCRMD